MAQFTLNATLSRNAAQADIRAGMAVCCREADRAAVTDRRNVGTAGNWPNGDPRWSATPRARNRGVDHSGGFQPDWLRRRQLRYVVPNSSQQQVPTGSVNIINAQGAVSVQGLPATMSTIRLVS